MEDCCSSLVEACQCESAFFDPKVLTTSKQRVLQVQVLMIHLYEFDSQINMRYVTF
jgi:hypothetical protein